MSRTCKAIPSSSKTAKSKTRVAIDDIVLVEAQGSYSMVHLSETRILANEKISELANRLPEFMLRVHKSYIVAKAKIELIEGDEIHIGGRRIPIGRVYKPNVARWLKG